MKLFHIFALSKHLRSVSVSQSAVNAQILIGLFLCPNLLIYGCLSHYYFALRADPVSVLTNSGNGSRFLLPTMSKHLQYEKTNSNASHSRSKRISL